jgi:hypothetical protein
MQILSNFDQSKKDLLELKNFKLKYGFEGFDKRNNFSYWNFISNSMDFELEPRLLSKSEIQKLDT